MRCRAWHATPKTRKRIKWSGTALTVVALVLLLAGLPDCFEPSDPRSSIPFAMAMAMVMVMVYGYATTQGDTFSIGPASHRKQGFER